MSSYSIFLILIVIVAFLLVVVIMVQNPKGGGLSSSFGGGGTQQLGGVKQTTDFLDKSTWVLGGTLIGLIAITGNRFMVWGDVEKMGPALAVSMLTILYGYSIKLVTNALTKD